MEGELSVSTESEVRPHEQRKTAFDYYRKYIFSVRLQQGKSVPFTLAQHRNYPNF